MGFIGIILKVDWYVGYWFCDYYFFNFIVQWLFVFIVGIQSVVQGVVLNFFYVDWVFWVVVYKCCINICVVVY